MSNPRSVTIKLTEKQKEQLHRVTGEGHSEIKVEAVDTPRSGMASKSALALRKAAVRVHPKVAAKLAAVRKSLSAKLTMKLK